MAHFEITGPARLKGTIPVRGSKNATTPILAATLLTDEECTLSNLPLIEDVFCMLDILKSMGADVTWSGKRTVTVRAQRIDPKKLSAPLVKKIRSSILLLGPLSARFGQFFLSHPGGCVIGARPVDTHMDALRALGVHVSQKGKRYVVDARKKKSGRVVLGEFSVTATENILMLAASLPGTTTIKIAACEPHVVDLCEFLVKMGVRIAGIGTHTLTVTGVKKRRGVTHTIVPDHTEAATFLILGAVTGSSLRVAGARAEHLDAVLKKMEECGVRFVVTHNSITVLPPRALRALVKVKPELYPGIPTDAQALFGVLATQTHGTTLIHDSFYEGRFRYIEELMRMGANARILNAHQALVIGPTKLHGTKITGFDLRAGASLIIAALAAQGTTIIENAHQVDRGYERIEERLRAIGAPITRVED